VTLFTARPDLPGWVGVVILTRPLQPPLGRAPCGRGSYSVGRQCFGHTVALSHRSTPSYSNQQLTRCLVTTTPGLLLLGLTRIIGGIHTSTGLHDGTIWARRCRRCAVSIVGRLHRPRHGCC